MLALLWWCWCSHMVAAHQVMHGTRDLVRIRLARDAYVYLHLPMIAALILLSLGAGGRVAPRPLRAVR
ncbi:low temperature requirement protein A [Micromonospora sp. NBC_01699]|nr:low temperature requirement protein A [Micromonospora sp. NBC_01699]